MEVDPLSPSARSIEIDAPLSSYFVRSSFLRREIKQIFGFQATKKERIFIPSRIASTLL